jgi:pimeloyl-ACP methyl ester carboxylesterase
MPIHRLPGFVLTDHEFTVPLDHDRPDDETITVYAREAVAPGKEHDQLPWLVFLQGGPGFSAPRPDRTVEWLTRALKEYRVLLLDQRGTGRSTPINHQTLARFASPQQQAAYLKHFRMDSIVRDAELIRHQLIGDEKWSVLGQSYGGFCAVHYLSAAPQSLKEAILTGGLAPINHHPDDVYRYTYRRVRGKNRKYFDRYPEDANRAREIADYLMANEVYLPNGDRLTLHRFQQMGMGFGASDGFEKVHYLFEEAFVSGAHGKEINFTFLHGFDNLFAFETNPIYAILHEPIYCEGVASNWSAERIRAEYPEFNLTPDRPVLFTGEMVFPWMFDEYQHLRPIKAAAEILAADADWPMLYDKAALQRNTVPVVAAMYDDDMYVERALSEETASTIRGIRVWVTNEYEHNGLRSDGEKVLGHLLDMLHGKI